MKLSPQTLGTRIRYFRKRVGMSQLEVENAANLSFGVISRIENGSIRSTFETLYKIFDVLD